MLGRHVVNSALLLVAGCAGAALFLALRVPAGAILGAIAGSAVLTVLRGSAPVAPPVRLVGLVLLGSLTGLTLQPATFTALAGIALPLGLSIAVLIMLSGLVATVLVVLFGLDWRTAVFACAPGGIGEVAIAAEETGARTAVVIALHLVRVFIVVFGALPVLIWFLGPR